MPNVESKHRLNKEIMTEQEANKIRKDILKASNNGVLDSVSEPLQLDIITFNPIDKDGDFEIEIRDEYSYINTKEAKRLIEYLTKSINAR